MAFCACECGSVFPIASMRMNSPSHLERVPAGPIGCVRVAVDDVINPGFSCAFEYCAIYGVWGSHGSAAMFANGFPET